MNQEIKNMICYILHNRSSKISAKQLVFETNQRLLKYNHKITERKLRTLINEINADMSVSGVIISSTTQGDSGYELTLDVDKINDFVRQLSAHAKSELKKISSVKKKYRKIINEELI